jgi:protein SCO1/2
MRRSRSLLILPLFLLAAGDHPAPAPTGASPPVPSCCQAANAPSTAAAQAASIPEGSLYAVHSSWQDQDGHALQLDDLAGRVRVVAMIFTHCQYACPRILSELRSLEAALPGEAGAGPGFVLISFDSARDDPATLKAYAAEQGLPAGRWTLLHGDADAVRELSVLLNVPYREDADGNFSHASVISVLDRDGRLVYQKRGLGGPLDECRQALEDAQQIARTASAP